MGSVLILCLIRKYLNCFSGLHLIQIFQAEALAWLLYIKLFRSTMESLAPIVMGMEKELNLKFQSLLPPNLSLQVK